MEPFSGWCSPFRGFYYPASYATDLAFTFLLIFCLPFPLSHHFGAFWDCTCVGWPRSCLAGIIGSMWGSHSISEPMNHSVHIASPPGLPVFLALLLSGRLLSCTVSALPSGNTTALYFIPGCFLFLTLSAETRFPCQDFSCFRNVCASHGVAFAGF